MLTGGRALAAMACCASLYAAAAAGVARAEAVNTFAVNTTDDKSLSENANFCSGEGEGGETCPLRAAVESAAAIVASGANSIAVVLPEGRYQLSKGPLMLGNSAAHGCFEGSTCPVALEGAGAGKTVIDGGFLRAIETITSAAPITISGLTITRADEVEGSAVYAHHGNGVVIKESTLTGDTNGSPINVYFDSLRLVDSTVSKNEVATGGAIFADHASVEVIRSALVENRVFEGGGAITLHTAGATVVDSTIAGNTVVPGGGGAQAGGAILLEGGGAGASIVFSTIAGNTAPVDGGIHGGESLSIEGSILSGNSGSQCGPGTSGNATGTNIIFGPYSCVFAGPAPLGVDPRLGPLTTGGAVVPTMALGPGSPAINAGGSSCSTAGAGGAASDARRISRPQGSACDLGAFEAAGDAAVSLAAEPEPSTVGGPLSLTATASNRGVEQISGVSVTFTLPTQAVFASAPAGCVAAIGPNTTVTCPVGTLAPGQSRPTTIVARPEHAGALLVTAAVTSEQADFNAADDTATLAAIASLAPAAPGGPTGGHSGASALVGRTFALDRRGNVVVRVSCPAGGGTCTDTVGIFSTGGSLPASFARRAALLASARKTIVAGATASIRLHLPSAAVQTAKRHKSLRVRLLLSARQGGVGVNHAYVITVKPPRRSAHG